MYEYPKVNYIGNKEKLSEWIIDNFPLKNGIVLDLFSGGGSVSYKSKIRGYKVITNDSLFSSYCLGKALIENKNEKLVLDINDKNIINYYDEEIFKKIEWLSENLYYYEEVMELSCLLNYSKKLESYSRFIFLSLLRRAMIRKLPYSRMNVPWNQIIKLRNEEYSYKKYGRRRAYHNKSFLHHIESNLDDYNRAVFDNGMENESYQLDAIKLLQNLDHPVDILYLDPPYPSTMNNYDKFYGPFDKIFDREIIYSDFTSQESFISYLYLIIQLAKVKANTVVMSLNSNSKPNYQTIESLFKSEFNNAKVIKKNHAYRVTGKSKKNKNYEVLIISEVLHKNEKK